jgi:hypothetical protein
MANITVKSLISKLKKEDSDLEIIIPSCKGTGNVGFVSKVNKTMYSFFGKEIPCIKLEE